MVYCRETVTGFPLNWKVGKPGEKKVASESQGTFFISPKSQGKSGNFFLNADCHENKKYCDFHLKIVAIIISCSR